jgi:hypothetical protein
MMVAAVAAGLCLSAQAQDNNRGQGRGQGGDRQPGDRPDRGQFDPAQFRQRMIERYKEQLEITDEGEWKVIQPLIEKVSEVRMSAMAGNFRGFMGGRGGRGPGGQGGGAAGAFGASNPEVEALQKAIDAKASNAEIKQALAKVAEARKAKEAELVKAQDALRKVLSVRQEALATLNGLL